MSDDLKIVTVPRELYYHEVAYVRGLEAEVKRLTAEANVERLRARFKDLWREKECDELRAEIARLQKERDEAWEARDEYIPTNVKLMAKVERLMAAIAYVRQRSARACEILNEFDATQAP